MSTFDKDDVLFNASTLIMGNDKRGLKVRTWVDVVHGMQLDLALINTLKG